jgi:hypothetical protein
MTNPDNDATDREKALLDLVRLDYDATLRTMTGVLATGTAIRVAGFAVWGTLAGFGLRDRSWALCLAAVIVVIVFAYADAYHAVLYRHALHRAIAIESMLDGYLNRLGIDAEDDEAVATAISSLETHRFGMYRTMPKLHPREFRDLRPRPIFVAVYPAFVSIAAVIALIVAF